MYWLTFLEAGKSKIEDLVSSESLLAVFLEQKSKEGERESKKWNLIICTKII